METVKKHKILKVCVFGSGSFGTSLATVAARNGHNVIIISRSNDTINEINTFHTNKKYFPQEISLLPNITATSNFEEIRNCDMIIHAIPVQSSIEYIKMIKDYLPNNIPYVIASKGILLKEKKFFSQIWDDLIETERNINHVILSGPSFAIEIMKNYPTLVTAACKNLKVANEVQIGLSSENFRIYITDDVLGVEIGGALKNVLAIIAGYIEGLGYKFNTLSALVTRGVFEISLFSEFMGGKSETLNGLSGIGDIMLSCLGDLSRNKKVGLAIARGEKIEDIINKAIEVAEGVPTLKVLYEIIKKECLKMPICETIYKLIFEGLNMEDARKIIMLRDLEHEKEFKII